MKSRCLLAVLAFTGVFIASFTNTVHALQEGFDEAATTIYMKKIRDEDRNYLKQVTLNTVDAITKSGEFEIKPYQKSKEGPVLSVTLPSYTFEVVKDGMSASEIARTGLSIVSDVGGLFGLNEEANAARNANYTVSRNSDLFDKLGSGEKVKTILEARVTLVDRKNDVDISRTISIEKIFDTKKEFEATKEAVFQAALVEQMNNALVEFSDGPGF